MITDSPGSNATRSSFDTSSGWPASAQGATTLPLRISVRCSSMCRCMGWTHPPPPLRISQRLKLPTFCWANGRLPAGFRRLVATWAGSNGLPLISHSISPPTLPRWTSKIVRLAISVFQLLGTAGAGAGACGITLLSGASSPMTNLRTGTL